MLFTSGLGHSPRATQFLGDFLLSTLLVGEMRERAHGLFEAAVAQIPEIAKFRLVPQSPPYHAEGPNLRAHVERILSGVLAIEAGASLATIDEFSADADIRQAVISCEETIREHAGFFKVFAIVHDAAKGDVVSLSASQDSKGAAEGFSTAIGGAPATIYDLTRYDKLIRAFAAQHQTLSVEELGAAFYDEYGISVHFYGHDRRGASPVYEPMRTKLLQHFGVPVLYHKLMAEVIWNHIDALNFFTKGADGKKYQILAARAGRVGLNVDTFLTFLACGVLLDAVFGSLKYRDGVFVVDPAPFLNMLRSEAEGMPARTEARRAVVERARKQAVKDALAEARLSPDEVFTLVHVPFGPERGTVMNAIYNAIRGSESGYDFGSAAGELVERIARARKLLVERNLSL